MTNLQAVLSTLANKGAACSVGQREAASQAYMATRTVAVKAFEGWVG